MAHYIQQEILELAPLVSLEKLKEHLKIEPEFEYEDNLVMAYQEAAVSYIESYVGYAVQKQEYLVKGESFQDVLSFSLGKITAVNQVQYLDENGDTQTLSEDSYTLKSVDKFENQIKYTVKELPKVQENKPEAVQLTVTLAGKKTPKAIIQAIKLLVGDFYEFRSNRPQKTVVDTVGKLLSTHRKIC